MFTITTLDRISDLPACCHSSVITILMITTSDTIWSLTDWHCDLNPTTLWTVNTIWSLHSSTATKRIGIIIYGCYLFAHRSSTATRRTGNRQYDLNNTTYDTLNIRCYLIAHRSAVWSEHYDTLNIGCYLIAPLADGNEEDRQYDLNTTTLWTLDAIWLLRSLTATRRIGIMIWIIRHFEHQMLFDCSACRQRQGGLAVWCLNTMTLWTSSSTETRRIGIMIWIYDTLNIGWLLTNWHYDLNTMTHWTRMPFDRSACRRQRRGSALLSDHYDTWTLDDTWSLIARRRRWGGSALWSEQYDTLNIGCYLITHQSALQSGHGCHLIAPLADGDEEDRHYYLATTILEHWMILDRSPLVDGDEEDRHYDLNHKTLWTSDAIWSLTDRHYDLNTMTLDIGCYLIAHWSAFWSEHYYMTLEWYSI